MWRPACGSAGSWPTHLTQDPLAWSLHVTPQPICSGEHTTSRLSRGRHGERQWAISQWLSGKDQVLEETVTRIPFSRSSDLAALACWSKAIHLQRWRSELTCCMQRPRPRDDEHSVSTSWTRYTLTGEASRFCESQPTHPLGGILTNSFDSRSPCLVFACDQAHNLWALIPMPQPISSGEHTTSRLSRGRHGEQQWAILQWLLTGFILAILILHRTEWNGWHAIKMFWQFWCQSESKWIEIDWTWSK